MAQRDTVTLACGHYEDALRPGSGHCASLHCERYIMLCIRHAWHQPGSACSLLPQAGA